MLKKIKINGLRGFGKEESIEFALPNGKEGSGLNIIVGPNNSGKTTITEAVKFYNTNSGNISFSEGKRNKNNRNRIDITYIDEDNKETEMHTVKEGGSQVNVIGVVSNQSPYVLPSRRYAEYNMYNYSYAADRYTYMLNSIVNSKNNRTTILNQYEQRIFDWKRDKIKFDKLLKRIIIDPFDWLIEQNEDGAYFIKIIYEDKSIAHTREGMGDGYWSIFTIIDTLYDSKKGDVIVIDEPELSLHPAFQKRVVKLLEEFSKDKQIIITTHSPYFVSLNAMVNGGKLIRTFKDEEGNIRTGNLKEEDNKFIASIMKNKNNPHILGLEAKELFFIEDNIVITEGQEDVVIIPDICVELNLELNASLFGWGAGGAENITKVLNMLNNLGYKKVSAIFDGDKTIEYKKCLEMYPFYNIIKLFKDDIRDKPESHKKAKEGITDEKGHIKEENKEQFKDIINEINEYHKNTNSAD